jgi:hypothetical protein
MANKTPAKTAKAKTKTNTAKKQTVKKNEATEPRQLRTPKYKAFRLQKRIKSPHPKLPNGFRLFGRAIKILARNWKFFGGIILIYAILNVIFVTGLSAGGSITALKHSLDSSTQSQGPNFGTATTLFTYMLGNPGSASGTATGGYQIVLLVMASLAMIWGLRQAYARDKTARIRDAYYLGMYPMVPFLLIIFVIGLQFVPVALGATLYSTAVAGGVAVLTLEKVAWGLLFFFLAVLSLYLVCSSIFALYIATLQNMTPVKALRSAKRLVQYRRWSIMRKIILLPIIFMVVATVIMLPVILFLSPAAPWIFFALTMLAIAVTHSYIYTLYRELL